MKQSFIKKLSLLTVLLCMTFGAFAQQNVELGLPKAPGEAVATQIDASTVHVLWEPSTTVDLVSFEVFRKLVSEPNWDNADLIATIPSATQKEYMDYTWGTVSYGVYQWGVVAHFGSASAELYATNAIDKDMITEVDVTVTLNSGEAATGTVVKFTNTSEPALNLVYEATLPATGKFAWDEFRKGTYDISVAKTGFTSITVTAELIDDEKSFSWVLEEEKNAPTDLYVSPTALASWKGTVPVPTEPVVVTIGEGTTTGFDLPINNFWNFSYNQQIFDESEIGYDEGTIFSIAFQYASATSFSNNIKIYMANTPKNVFESTSDWVAFSELTEVYSGNVTFVNTNEGNWVTIEFDTPFTYTGGNVVLATLDETTGYAGSTRTFYRHTTGGNKSLVSYRDSGAIDPAAPISASYANVRNYRNNVQFGMNVPVTNRSAEQYKVFLDGTFIANTGFPSYQYNVADLTVGQDYFAEVLVEYTTGQSARANYTFTYEGCDAYDAPTALAAVQPIGTKDAVLTWTNPDLTDVDFLRVYRDGNVYVNKISMDIPFSTWTDPELENGTYNYALQLVYDDGAETCLDAATKSITIVSTGTIKGTVTYMLGGNVQGATITVSNTDKTYTFTTAADGKYTGTVEAGTYAVKCEMEGHESQTANATVLYVGTKEVNFVLFETPFAVAEVTATLQDNGTVYVAWDGSTGGGGGGGTTGETFEEGFEAGTIPTGWVIYDVDNDGYNWENTAVTYTTFDAHTGSYCMTSASYVNYVGALTPNNYLVTPALAIGSGSSELKFWVDGQDTQGYHNEKYYVKVSTTGNAVADFTTTLHTATSTANWAEITVDLSAYADQTIYIAFVHTDVTDQYFLKLDDVSITNVTNRASKSSETLAAAELTAKDYANSFRTSGMSAAEIEKASIIAMDRAAEARAFALTQPQTIVEKGTRALTGYEVYRNGCYGGEPELLASLPISVTNFYDNNWSNLDFGVYKWGVVATYDLNESEIVYSNCIDKDMYTEVSVTVNLNTAESPEGAVVMFTNISEPDMELVYEIELDETGYFLFEEFRKGEYDILVSKAGYESIEIAAEEIVEATDFVWVLEELIEPVLDLYVSPTGYAMWQTTAAAAFEGFYESFDNGIPATWTVEHAGTAPDVKWKPVTEYIYYGVPYTMNGTPFVMVDMDGDGASGSTANETLISPVVDASMCSELYLSFVHYYRHLTAPAAKVEVYDGSAWVTVYNPTTGSHATPWTPTTEEIDVTPYINENFQVRFNYSAATWVWYWAVDEVMLSETQAKDRAVQYSKVWLDGIFCDDVVGTTYQHDVTGLVEGQEYTTEVAVMYTTGLSEKVSYTWTYTPCENYPGATTFTAELDGENAKLNWVLPGSTGGGGTGYEGWMNYCINDEVAGRIGYSESAGEDMTMAIRFTPSDLSTYGVESGQTITKVALGMGQELANVNTMEILFWEGGSSITDAGTLIYTQAITNFTTFSDNTMVDIPLTTPVTVDPSKELRVGWRLVNTAGYPFGRDAGPVAEPGKSDLFKCSSLNGGAWVSYSAVYGWSNNICIKAFVSGSGKSIVLGEDYISNSNTPAVSIATAVEVPQSQVLFSKGELVGVSSNKVAINNSKDMLYNNDVPTTTSGLITVQFSTGELVQIADDFDGLAGWTIDKIVTAGFNNQGNLPSVFGVAFYEDNSGVPGTELYSNTNCAATEVDGIFTITLPEAYILPEDGKYWISMYAVRATGGLDIGNWRFDIYTSTTAIGSKLHLCDHNDLFGTGNTNWQSVDPGLVAGVVSMTFELHGVIGTPPNPGIEEPIIGVNIYRDGEFLAFVAEGTNTYTDEGMPYGEHEYCVQVVYESYAMSCIDNMLCDEVERPYPCEAPTNLAGEYVEADGVFGGYVTWGSIPAEPIFEDVESHEAFTLNSPGEIGWSYIDGDGGETYVGSTWTFPNGGSPMAFVVFDPSVPGLTYPAHSGSKYFADFNSAEGATNDWIISPELSGATEISFWAMSLTTQYGAERFRVCASSTGTAQSNFTAISTGSYVEAPDSWTEFTYAIPAGTKYVAINCVSNDAFAFFLDDITIQQGGKTITLDADDFNAPVTTVTPEMLTKVKPTAEQIAKYAQPVVDNTPQVTRNIQGYNVYRSLADANNYSVIATVAYEEGVAEYSYYDTDVVAQEKYDYQVTATYVYEDGYECESEVALTPEGADHVFIHMNVGIDNHNTDSRIYPNPASNYITVEATNMNRITVMSVVGQVVYDVKVDSNQERINVSNLKSGVYVVRISSEAGVSSERITIVR